MQIAIVNKLNNLYMKLIFTFFLAMLVFSTYSQKRLDEYKASNGITYHEGDTIKMGTGSMPNGDYKYLQMGGWAAAVSYNSNKGSDQFNIGRGLSGTNIIVKKIHEVKMRGAKKVYFTVVGKNITNYNLLIDDAIESCEITPCNDSKKQTVQQEDIYDKIAKLKKLLDSGAINQQEYDSSKAKLLSQQ